LGGVLTSDPAAVSWGSGRIDVFACAPNPIALDAAYPNIRATTPEKDSWVILSCPAHRGLYKVMSAIEAAQSDYGLSGKTTQLALDADEGLDGFYGENLRATMVFGESEELSQAEEPLPPTIVEGTTTLKIDTNADELPVGRVLLVIGEDPGTGAMQAEPVVLDAVNPVNVSHPAPIQQVSQLVFRTGLTQEYKRETVRIYGNVALATHGETVSQILGAGDASRSFQRFELKRTPLTYRSATNQTGADSELTVRVGDIEWTEKPTLYRNEPAERAYTLTTDEQGKTWIVFGDGRHGARLPSGVNNVRASYRQGLGKDGNVGADKLTQLMTRPLGLKGVSNPLDAQGGTDPEPVDQARRTMPLGARTLGRTVSLLDYEDFAMAFTGIAKAQAQVLQLQAGPTIAISVAGQDGATLSTSNPVWSNLLLALKDSGDPHVRVALLSYQPSTFFIGLKVKRDPAYELKPLLAAVEGALRNHFSFDARSLGQPVLQSEVIAAAHSVPGVVAVDLDYLYGGSNPIAQTVPSRQTRLLASRMRVSGGAALPAELLTLDPGPLVRLEEMT
jgi:hypothetical protein